MHMSEIEEDQSSNAKDTEGINGIHANSDCTDADEAKPSIEPSVGMAFDSVNDAWEFYKTFGKETGFPVMKSTCNKNVAGDIRSYTFACARAGKSYAVSEKPSIKCGCLAKLVLRLDCLNGYVISKIVLEHNHELKPENAGLFRCNRYVSASVEKETRADVESCVKLDLKRSHTSMKDNVGSRRNAVEQDRYNSLCILFHELAKRAAKSERLYNEIKQWIVMKLEELKNLEVEPKVPATNDCKEGEEKDSPEEEIVDTVVDDAVLEPKRNKKSPIASSDGNASNEPDGPVASSDVPPPTSKRQGGPPGSENKNKKTTDSSGARNVQAVPQQESNEVAPPAHMYQPIGVAPPAHMYQANGVAPQVHMYQPWVFYGHPRPHYVGPPMDPYAMSYFHMQGSTLPLPTTPNTQKFGG